MGAFWGLVVVVPLVRLKPLPLFGSLALEKWESGWGGGREIRENPLPNPPKIRTAVCQQFVSLPRFSPRLICLRRLYEWSRCGCFCASIRSLSPSLSFSPAGYLSWLMASWGRTELWVWGVAVMRQQAQRILFQMRFLLASVSLFLFLAPLFFSRLCFSSTAPSVEAAIFPPR